MTEWIEVMAEQALANGEHVLVDVDGIDVAVFKIDDQCYAVADICPHDGGDLASGTVEGEQIICPRHGARFCLKTGAVKSPPAYENIDSYPVRIVAGKIELADSPV
jgi:3-phenylpropionate/trans-cinnamate dioxygenase ferredoxin subunit